MDKYNGLIPENTEGKPTDLYYSTVLLSDEEAEDCFSRAVHRLLNPRVWHDITGSAAADFVLMDQQGNALPRLLEPGDYVRIDIPGPGPTIGSGYDWVMAKTVVVPSEEASEPSWAGIVLTPCPPPGAEKDKTAHFFQTNASSTFIVEKQHGRITVSYHGRNEVANVRTGNIVDNVRNAFVAFGAMAGLSEVQWSSFCKGLLAAEIGGKASLAE